MIKSMNDKPLIIVGASARAAAFSAYRAGYTPYWLDQFGDRDLHERFRGQIISDYPEDMVDLMEQAPAAPFIFTGALENHTGVLERLSRQRTLLGNAKPVCLKVRDPSGLHQVFQRNRIPCPAIRIAGISEATRHDWLIKPARSAGGIGIERYEGQPVDERYYLQEYLPGDSYSAVYVGGRGYCRLLGVTRQWVGLPAFHAREFGYCGSIGPIDLTAADNRQWRRIGEVISNEFKLAGLFGIDAIKRKDKIYPVEVNPRYTASVEVLELALGCKAIKLHCDACNDQSVSIEEQAPRYLVGKAILFAPGDLTFKGIIGARKAEDGVGFFRTADVPAHGTEIKQGHPILTVIVTGDSISSVGESLRKAADNIFSVLSESSVA